MARKRRGAESSVVSRDLCTQRFLHTDALIYKCFNTQTLLHTKTFTHRRFNTQTL